MIGEVRDGNEVLRHAPELIALARTFGNLLLQRLIELAQRFFGAPPLGDVDMRAD